VSPFAWRCTHAGLIFSYFHACRRILGNAITSLRLEDFLYAFATERSDMNAIIRDKDEAQVLTHEAIEVHLLYLRSGLDGVQAALPVLRDKIDQLSFTMDAKIEKLSTTVDARLEKLSTTVDTKIEKLDAKLEKTNLRIDVLTGKLDERFGKTDARIDSLGDKISKLADGLAEIRGYHKTMIWVLSLAGTGAAVVSIARTFGWF
jgi:chromosome segregation ATPase